MSTYYVGFDVHKASICIAVLNASGKLVIEPVVGTSVEQLESPAYERTLDAKV